jgi:hypothetical protein
MLEMISIILHAFEASLWRINTRMLKILVAVHDLLERSEEISPYIQICYYLFTFYFILILVAIVGIEPGTFKL